MPTKKTTKDLIAAIQIGPRQYIVKKDDQLVVDKIDFKVGDTLTIKEVLLIIDGETAQIGQPFLEGASVDLKLEDTKKGDKIRVARYKAKSRYRRVKGFRPTESHLTVTAIKQK